MLIGNVKRFSDKNLEEINKKQNSLKKCECFLSFIINDNISYEYNKPLGVSKTITNFLKERKIIVVNKELHIASFNENAFMFLSDRAKETLIKLLARDFKKQTFTMSRNHVEQRKYDKTMQSDFKQVLEKITIADPFKHAFMKLLIQLKELKKTFTKKEIISYINCKNQLKNYDAKYIVNFLRDNNFINTKRSSVFMWNEKYKTIKGIHASWFLHELDEKNNSCYQRLSCL